MKPTNKQLTKALRDLLDMVIRLDPTDQRRAAVRRAKRVLANAESSQPRP